MAAAKALAFSVGTCVIALLLGAAAHAARGGVSAQSAAPATYKDPPGDSGSAPDITSIVISDAADGLITFQVVIGNQPTLAPGAFIYVDLDSDQNSTTGSPGHLGADRVFYIGDQGGFGALGWNGASYVRAPVASLVASYSDGVATFTFNKSDVGVGTGFNFYVASQSEVGPNPASSDLIPDYGMVNYRLQSLPPPPPPAPLRLSVTDYAARKAKAGATWIVEIEVTRSDTNRDLGAEGSITCKAMVGSARLRAAVRTITSRTTKGTASHTALCGWHLPIASRGKTVAGTVTAGYQGAKASHTFRARIQ